ncbi:unnamed protein product [Diabrotica balteata]|uniref:Uncharacterized protein n=1 Tax=Diabrotica balteata TaxID=107213 RepID=A0A9N9TB11_DIABA|nr:unnamed protein product [Diabrotica balteata]
MNRPKNYWTKPLTDEELLLEAQLLLQDLPLDNNQDTDIEEDIEEDEQKMIENFSALDTDEHCFSEEVVQKDSELSDSGESEEDNEAVEDSADSDDENLDDSLNDPDFSPQVLEIDDDIIAFIEQDIVIATSSTTSCKRKRN